MRHILWLEWQQFYIEPGDDRLVLVEREGKVLDYSRAAAAFGVSVGMAFPQARTLCHGAKLVRWNPELFAAKQKEWLELCTDFSHIIEPIDQHIAALDLTGQVRQLDIIEELVRRLANKFPLPLKYGAGATKWIAQLAARHLEITEAVERPASFLSGLPVSDLLPVEASARERLLFLGYRTIGEVAALPLTVLREQFGETALTIHQTATAGCFEEVKPLYPPASIQRMHRFDTSVEDAPSIDHAIRLLATALGRRLDGRQSTHLSLWFDFESGQTETIDRTFTKPVYSVTTLRAALRVMTGELEFIREPVSALRLCLRDLKNGHSQQSNLIVSDNRPVAEAALGRVQNTFGSNIVQLASKVEAPRRERVLKAWGDALGWR